MGIEQYAKYRVVKRIINGKIRDVYVVSQGLGWSRVVSWFKALGYIVEMK